MGFALMAAVRQRRRIAAAVTSAGKLSTSLSVSDARSTFDQLAVVTGRESTGGKESRGKIMGKSKFEAGQCLYVVRSSA